MSVLAFVFDHLLLGNNNQSNGAPPISKVARTFLQCLAAIQYPQDAIIVLVAEFKLAFSRALSLPESQLKHTRVRALTALLSQVLDTQTSVPSSRSFVNPSHFARLLIRKGFISDLARATHSLNLNSPHLIGTVNNILKPLEVLTRIVNQVASSPRRADGGPAAKLTTTTTISQQPDSAEQTSHTSLAASIPDTSQPIATQSPNPQAGEEERREEGGGGRGEDASVTPSTQGGASGDTSFLEATHESLIPLEEEEEEMSGEREQRAEIISLAHELGRQRREELSVAGSRDVDIQVRDRFLCSCSSCDFCKYIYVYVCNICISVCIMCICTTLLLLYVFLLLFY